MKTPPVGRGLRTRRKPKASDTPETDAYVAKLAHDWVLDFGAFDLLLTHARELERDRNEAIQERERWKIQAEQKWGMRRELEELLGVGDTESEEQFAKGVAALRHLIQERDEAREERERYKRMWEESRMETVEGAQ
jgi:hypothetical protein